MEAQANANDEELPQCKIKRNYSCIHCSYFTQNPRFHLTHLRDVHGERIVINKCSLCLYASRHFQKLVRHMKMVHGSMEGITGQSRKRTTPDDAPKVVPVKEKELTPPPAFVFPEEPTINIDNLFNDLELSRNSLRDLAALYFAENHVNNIMTQMEEADCAQVPPPAVPIKRKPVGNTFFDNLRKSFVGKDSLICSCGHESKCFSESVIHQKSCKQMSFCEQSFKKPNLVVNSGSTRCQNCRRRCKSSSDLLNHLKTCSISSEVPVSPGEQIYPWNPPIQNFEKRECNERDVELPMEFEDTMSSSSRDNDVPNIWYLGIETATGYGEVTKEITSGDVSLASFRKVFKCPRCSFWASTASRFHVHIVGHLNRKPFKCSLCAYRSNWRWDITKHIRLRTIRNLSHKNARVLMNDETGGRNYTQYNKYIAKLKITTIGDDPKGVQSSPLSKAAKEVSPSVPVECDSNDKGVTLLREPDKGKCLLEHNPSDTLASTMTSKAEKTSFYCRKCDFRHVSRDAVLAHMKIHPNGLYAPFDAAKNHPCKDELQMGINSIQKNSITQPADTDLSNNIALLTEQGSKSLSSPLGNIREHSPLLNGIKRSPVLIGPGANSTSDNGPSDKRGPSPFRCGHCHQLSNWKHVIQRHCRLKHSGHIRIEAYDRSSDKRTPVYRQISFPGGEETRQFPDECHLKQANDRLHNLELDKYKQTTQEHKPTLPVPPTLVHFSTSSALTFSNIKSECTYSNTEQDTDNSHSLPRPSDAQSVRSPVPTTETLQNEMKPLKNTMADPKVISYCPKCPERFASGSKKLNGHLKSHSANMELICDICDFATAQKVNMQSHAFVHTTEYQEKTNHFAKTGKEDPVHPAPKLIQITTPSTSKKAWIVEGAQYNSRDDLQKTSSFSVPPVPIEVPERCPYCPFETACQAEYKIHLQYHTRMAHHAVKFSCEQCDFITDSKVNWDNHKRIHLEALSTPKSTSLFISYDKLKMPVPTTNEEKDGKPKAPTKTVKLKGKQECSKKKITLNLRCRRSSGQNGLRKSVAYTPPATQKTILVNPKTGQVVRRN